MRALSIAVGLVAAAAICAGYMMDTNTYVTEKYEARVGYGEGLDHVAGRYYHKDERKIIFDEFRTEVWAKNKKLTANGRSLQPNDLVIVEVYKKIAKK